MIKPSSCLKGNHYHYQRQRRKTERETEFKIGQSIKLCSIFLLYLILFVTFLHLTISAGNLAISANLSTNGVTVPTIIVSRKRVDLIPRFCHGCLPYVAASVENELLHEHGE